MRLPPRESAFLISKIAKDVKISDEGIEKMGEMIEKCMIKEKYDLKTWKTHELHPKTMDEFAVDWIFFVDTLNFSFWSEEGQEYRITYNGKTYSGYWSLCAAVNRAIEEGYPILSADFYSKISLEKLKYIFRSDTGTEIPLIEERKQVLRDTGNCLIEKFSGSFVNCLALSKNCAEKLLNLIVENFSSYKDVAELQEQKVSFYKRAQILIGDIWACCEGIGYGSFEDIDHITMFADYRIPQALVYFGVLEYSDNLKHRLQEGSLFKSGERLEIEIRGCTIWAIELICRFIRQKNTIGLQSKEIIFNSITVDNYIWDYRRNHAEEMKHVPFHKIRCIYY